jgi:hypothetical protein
MARQIQNLNAKMIIVSQIAARLASEGKAIRLNDVYADYNNGCFLWSTENQFCSFVSDQLETAGCYVKSSRKGGTWVSTEEFVELENSSISRAERQSNFLNLYEAIIAHILQVNDVVNVNELVDGMLSTDNFTGSKNYFMISFRDMASTDSRINMQSIRKAGTFCAPAGMAIID